MAFEFLKRVGGFGGNDEYEESEEDFEETSKPRYDDQVFSQRKGGYSSDYSGNGDVGSGRQFFQVPATTQLKIVLKRPSEYREVYEIADSYKNKNSIVLNMESVNKENETRILDFLAGVGYALDGALKRIGRTTYLLAPYDVEISGELINELENNSDFY